MTSPVWKLVGRVHVPDCIIHGPLLICDDSAVSKSGSPIEPDIVSTVCTPDNVTIFVGLATLTALTALIMHATSTDFKDTCDAGELVLLATIELAATGGIFAAGRVFVINEPDAKFTLCCVQAPAHDNAPPGAKYGYDCVQAITGKNNDRNMSSFFM